jgi:hypothetical protein
MKILKILGYGFLFITLVLLTLYMYFDSDFVETRRLRNQIELNLGITLTEIPKSIHRESYGWAEEGGDKALLLLNAADCRVVSQAMTGEEVVNVHSEYMASFKIQNYTPATVRTWRSTNERGDSTSYALDASTCILYRVHHYE